MSVVIVSVPFDGPTGAMGRACAHAAKRAADEAGSPVEVVILDAGVGPFGEHVASNARRAAEDDDVLGYLGDFHSAATEVSLPILEAAHVPHVSFSNTLRRLVGRSFASVIPNDERQVAGLVEWMVELGIERPFLLDDGEEYGMDMRWLVHRELAARGRAVAGGGRLFECATEPPAGVAQADGIFLGTYARPVAAETLRNIRAVAPNASLFGTDGLLSADLAAEAPDGLYVSAPPGPPGVTGDTEVYAAYAHEAMALLLDALALAGPHRAGIVAHLRSTRDRHAPMGRYGFDEWGASTLSSIRRFRSEGGRFLPAG